MKLVISVLSAASLFAQDPVTLTSDVQLVTVEVQVTEKGTGRVIDLLGPKDFQIRDNATVRLVSHFSFETMPLDIVFLLYGKGISVMSRPEQVDFRRGLAEIVNQIREQDRAAILRGESAARAVLPLTGDKEQLRRALLPKSERLNPMGRGSRLFDAVAASLELFPAPKDRSRRRAILVVTDDADTGSKITSEGLITKLLEADTTVNAVFLVTQPLSYFPAGGAARTPSLPGIPSIDLNAKLSGQVTGRPSMPLEATVSPATIFVNSYLKCCGGFAADTLSAFTLSPQTRRSFTQSRCGSRPKRCSGTRTHWSGPGAATILSPAPRVEIHPGR